jgi:hypothetical protein
VPAPAAPKASLAELSLDAILHPADLAGAARERAGGMQGRLQVAQSERRLARGDGSYVLAQ